MKLPTKTEREIAANKAKEEKEKEREEKLKQEFIEKQKKIEEYNKNVKDYQQRIINNITRAINKGETTCKFYFNQIWAIDKKALDQAIDNLIKDNPDYTIKHSEGTEYWTDVNYETGNESNCAESVIRIHVTWDN